jgi:hypothetical protein
VIPIGAALLDVDGLNIFHELGERFYILRKREDLIKIAVDDYGTLYFRQ